MTITDTELAETGNEPLTPAEHEAIKRYREQIAGTPDCFDVAEEHGVGPFPDEFTHDDRVKLIKDWYVLLGGWRDAITVLAEELAEATGRAVPSIAWPPPMSGAATRYVGAEMLSWHQAMDDWRRGTIEFFLGSDQYGYRFDTSAPRPEGWRHVDGSFWVNG